MMRSTPLAAHAYPTRSDLPAESSRHSGLAGVLALLLVVSFLWAVPPTVASAATSTAGQFVSLQPSRVLDTRYGVGASGTVRTGSTVSLQVAGRGGVPAVGAGAVMMNVTVTDTSGAGYVTVYPSGTEMPLASNLNFAQGETIPNLVVAKLGTDGKVNLSVITSRPGGFVSLVADVTGYLRAGDPVSPGAMVVQSPSRILDTRAGIGATGPIVSGSVVGLQVAGRGGVPATGASAVVLNVTVTDTTSPGYVTAYPSGTSAPLASNLNFVSGQTIPNLVVAKLGTDGKVNLAPMLVFPGTTVSLVADVAAYLLAGTPTLPGTFASQAPSRILDTRVGVGGFGPVTTGTTTSLQVAGRHGVPATGVAAVVLNVTVADPTAEGYVTVHPSGTTLPTASNLNFVAGKTIPNLVVAKLGADGKVNLTAMLSQPGGTVSLIADVAGYVLTDAPTLGVVTWGSAEGIPPQPVGIATAISVGGDHNLALRADRTVAEWGIGAPPAAAGTLTGITKISAGFQHNLALTSSGSVLASGYDYAGQTDVPAGLTNVTAVSAGGAHSLALTNGTVVAWGDSTWGQATVPTGLTGVSAISAGYSHSLALKTNGTVVAWGDNSFGELNVPAGLTGVVAIAAGTCVNLALKQDGTVVAWGDNEFGKATTPLGLKGVTSIAAGGDHSLALRADGTVVAWGKNTFGETSVPSGMTGITAIAAGTNHSVALTADGTVVAWGGNNLGQTNVPRSLVGATAVAAGAHHSIALLTDGTVASWGANDNGQQAVPAGLSGVTAIAAGGNHTVALTKDGTVVVWGTTLLGWTVDPPAGLSGVIAIAAGTWFSMALKSDGTVVTWGGPIAPVPEGLSGVTAIAAGGGHSLALKSDSTVVAWGDNGYGQSVPAVTSGVIAIAAGVKHSLALKGDGTVVAWGDNSYLQSQVPAGLSGVTAISAGLSHSLVLKIDGTLVTWGSYYSGGVATVPAGLSGVTTISAGLDYNLVIAPLA